MRAFCPSHPSWIVEGCYTHLVHISLAFSPRLVFLNPGEAQCRANCRARPWEAHKYASRAEQDERLDFLLAWVSDYYSRDDDMSLYAHSALYAEYAGPKHEFTAMPLLEPPPAELIEWTV